MVGFFAYSLMGHDKNKIYVISKETQNDVYLVDGDIRTLENPKRKNKKHVQIVKNTELKVDFEKQTVTNETVKRAIKLFSKGI